MVIELCEMKCDSMTAAEIRHKIVESFANFEISEGEVLRYVTFVTDRGSNIRAAIDDFANEICLAHFVNNIVSAMVHIDSIKPIVKDAASLVRYVKTSHIGSQLTSKL